MKKHSQFIIFAFILPIYILGIFHIVWPDKAISEKENRSLAKMPAFNWSSIKNGSFSSQFEIWFSDQFPFRDILIDLNNKSSEILKLSFGDDSITLIQGPANDLGSGEFIVHDGDLFENKSDPSLDSNSEETEKDSVPTESIEDKSETTTEVTETEVQESFVPPPIIDAPVDDYSAVIIVNNQAMELYGFSQAKTDRYIELINKLQFKLPSSQVYSLVAPTSIEFYAPSKYSSLSSSQKSAIDYIYSKLDKKIKTVDAYNSLYESWQEYIYFRSDHHWTALGAFHGYEAYAAAAGLKAEPIENFTQGSIPGAFLGSLYRYTQSTDLENSPDTVFYYEPKTSAKGYSFQTAALTEGREIDLIYKQASIGNQYLAFIEGDHPIALFQTEIQNDRKALVIKESYGNAFVPFLVNHYEEIFVIDPRKINMDLPTFIVENNIQDVIVINYSFAVGNKTWVDGFEKMIG